MLDHAVAPCTLLAVVDGRQSDEGGGTVAVAAPLELDDAPTPGGRWFRVAVV